MDQMNHTFYKIPMILLICVAAIVLSVTGSFILSAISTLTVGFILISSLATLVVFGGWTFGFVELTCCIILVGIFSIDFVILLCYAYCSSNEKVGKGTTKECEGRTKHVLLTMGPSVLKISATRILSAFVMLFTIVAFFQKFNFVLFILTIQSTIGSLFVLLVLLDCLGPSDPSSSIGYSAITNDDKVEGSEQKKSLLHL